MIDRRNFLATIAALPFAGSLLTAVEPTLYEPVASWPVEPTLVNGVVCVPPGWFIDVMRIDGDGGGFWSIDYTFINGKLSKTLSATGHATHQGIDSHTRQVLRDFGR